MAEYIEREALLKSLTHECKDCENNFGYDCEECDYAHAMLYVKAEKAADVQPTARKPIKISEEEFWVQGYLVNEKYYCCPNCDKVLGNLRVHNVHELINEYKFCSECGQGLDWNNVKELIVK